MAVATPQAAKQTANKGGASRKGKQAKRHKPPAKGPASTVGRFEKVAIAKIPKYSIETFWAIPAI